MTFQLARDAAKVSIPAAPGISSRACSRVLETMASIAKNNGEFRWGIRGCKLAELTQYSLSVIRRAQAHLVKLGILERLEVGGGRKSTHWRIHVDKLRPTPESGHTSNPPVTQPAASPDTAQGRQPSSFLGVYSGGFKAKLPPLPPRFSVEEVLYAPVCEHGGDGRKLPGGKPRCPKCRFRAQFAHRTGPND